MKNRIAAAALFAGCLALAMAILLYFHRLDTGGDNLDFILLARSLQWGHWADILGWPRPAGYAAFIAGVLYVLGIKLPLALFSIPAFAINVLKSFNVLFFAITSAVVCRWVHRLSQSVTMAMTVAVLFGVNQILAATTSIIGAEPLFLLLVYSSLLVWERHTPRISPWFILIGLPALLIKYQGFALAAAVVAWVVSHRKRDRGHIAMALLFAALMAALASCQWLGNRFILQHVTASDPYGYGQHISWLTRITTWIHAYTFAWPELLLPKILGDRGLLSLAHAEFLTWPFVVVVLLFSVDGFVLTLRRLGLTLSHLFFMAFVGILIVWPDYLLRYLVPIAPIGLWFFVEGLAGFLQSLEVYWAKFPIVGTWRRVFIVVVALLVGWSVSINVFAGVKNWRNIVRLQHETPWYPERYRISREDDFADYMESALWIGGNLPSNSVVYCRKALFVELAAQRKAEYYSGFASGSDLWAAITNHAASHPTYILRDAFSPDSTYGKVRELQLMPVLRAHESELEPLYTTPYGSEILRVVTGPGLSPRPGSP